MRTPPAVEFNQDGHWYTSFPSLNHWGAFGHAQYAEVLRAFISGGCRPLHLYLHIPFCKKLCWYCVCNLTVTDDRQRIQTFVDHMCREVDLFRSFFNECGVLPNIADMHFGGGTPSYLDQRQLKQLCDHLNLFSPLKAMDEVAMEIDPRTVNQDDLRFYAEQGVSRISFGVQDFDPKVQEAINRVQPPEMIEALLTPDIRRLFRGVNFDLLYGLPFQTSETIAETVRKVKEFRPDRVTLLKYCHVPEVRKHMRLIKEQDLPPASDLPSMFCYIADELMEAGYQWIGLDHFALPTDDLALAQANGTVGRTFNGFTPGTTDMIGIGPTTTAAFGQYYAQSFYDLNDYYNAVNRGEFPIQRGFKLTYDDSLRREVIFSLLCQQACDMRQYGNYFNKELTVLESMNDLCYLKDGWLRVTPYGRLLLRNICKVFDTRDVKPEHHRISQFPITRRKVAA